MTDVLTRGRVLALVLAVLTIGSVVALTAVLARGWARGEGGAYAPHTTLVRTRVTPARSLFGQPLLAQADVVVDPSRVEPATVQLKVDFRPFNVRSEARTVLDGPGRAAIVRFRYELQCVARGCVPRGTPRGAAFVQPLQPAIVTLRDDGGRTRTSRAAWPSFAVASRLTEAEIAFSTPRAPTLAVAPVTWRIAPGTVGWLAVAAAALLLLGAGWLVVSLLAADAHPLRARRIPAHLTPIDRALALAEYAAARGEVDESRKALERLAAELRRRHGFAHADDAERLAWSEHGPSARTVAELATSVRSNGAR